MTLNGLKWPKIEEKGFEKEKKWLKTGGNGLKWGETA